MKKLSIIIPYYNTQKYTDELLDCLNNQITDEVEVLLIDDGSKNKYKTEYSWVNVIRKENGGVSSARNLGLDNASGEYIAFIDSDDLVSDNYISLVIDKINNEKFDYCYLSWKTLTGSAWNFSVKLNSIDDKFPETNLCCWNRIYKKSKIKDLRFNELKLIAEDAEFIREIEKRCSKKSFISDFIYFYRSGREDGLSVSFSKGKLNTKRIVYNFNHITKNMKYLIDEIKYLDKYSEIIIMTNKNDIPELSEHAMIINPREICGTELRGEPTNLFKLINIPIKTQIVIWTHTTYAIGGIETFIYNFCYHMHDKYDILVLYEKMDSKQILRLKKLVRVEKNDLNRNIICNSLLINRITDSIPPNINYEQSIQMIHGCKYDNLLKISKDRDIIVPVSKCVEKSFYGEIYPKKYNKIINNVTLPSPTNRILKLISGTRLSSDKGEKRIISFAKQLKNNNIPFIWYIFTDGELKENVDGIICMKSNLNFRDYIVGCDYLVQLSDSEAFCYSVVESLELGVPVIVTPFNSIEEIGVKDGINGFVVPFDMKNIDIKKIYDSYLNFEYHYNNDEKINEWINILGEPNPIGDYIYLKDDKNVTIKITQQYYSLVLQREVYPGEIFEVSLDRANTILQSGYCEIM